MINMESQLSKFIISLIGGSHIDARTLLDIQYSIIDGLAISLAYPSGEKGGLLLVHMKTTCLRGAYRKGGGESTLL
jgi:hypothetical protein